MPFGSPPAGSGSPPPPAWTPPTDTEHALVEARARGDWTAYYDVLSRVRLYYQMSRKAYDAQPDRVHRVFTRDERTGARYWELFTDGLLPAPRPDDLVYSSASLRRIAELWNPQDPPTVVINPGTPCELALPYGPPGTTDWSRAADRPDIPSAAMRLRALHVGGALHGPVAHGLACGALLCVSNGSLWNAPAWHGHGYDGERRRLREWWGITTRAEWQYHLRNLLACEASSSVWEFALSLRRTIARDFGGHVDTGYWRQAVATVIRADSEGATVITEDGVTKTDPRPASETEARITGVQHLIGRITRYEARMRADGILDENRHVTSVEAWDLGRASKMARWGLGARFATLPETESALARASRSAALAYRSWPDFSAGYVLGRCLHFDEEEFGDWYQDMVSAHRILTTEPGSPWLNIPFR
ncbi:DUF1266 domain-containing protein [Streptomyces sp. NPDC091219]|uniref:DUF1266 domain-containing protein n=1 Tax=Streptomyces sp. NPDC091219 TaxID=3155193 RepID=UPI00344C96CA